MRAKTQPPSPANPAPSAWLEAYDPAIGGESGPDTQKGQLLERDGELAAISEALEETSGGGRVLLIEGVAGIGKTALIGELEGRAGLAGHRVLRARGSEMEREFGFGIVRQLFAPELRSLDEAGRARLFVGPAALAAPIFELAGDAELDAGSSEGALYGLYWLIVALAERGPVTIAIDDAHWSDAASLRFIRYLGRRLDGFPVLIGLAARPHEPGVQAEMLSALSTDLDLEAIRPSPLSASATAAMVRTHLGDCDVAVEGACYEVTGGNPFLVEELLVELDLAGEEIAALSPERIATVGPERISTTVIERARRLDPLGPEIVRAVAVLGDRASLRPIAALAKVEQGHAAEVLDGLLAAAILVDGPGPRFAHPLLRTAVYEAMPAATRGTRHSRAASLLAEQGADPEEVAAHLLLSEPGSMAGGLGALDAAARRAADRGAPESAATYLRRALAEPAGARERGELLHRLGRLEVALRDPASIAHLQEAAELAEDPRQAIDISLELADVLSIAGQWEPTVQVIDAALARFGGTELPGLLDLEALRAALRGYDPAQVEAYDRDLPRLRALVEGRSDEESSQLRWILASIGSIRESSRSEVVGLIAPSDEDWDFVRGSRESSFVGQALSSLVVVDALEEGERIVAALLEDGRRRGSLLAMVGGKGFAAAVGARRGRLGSSEADLNVAWHLLKENELSLMALTTVVFFALDAVVERRGMEKLADLMEGLELPPPFGETQSGGMALEVRAAIRTMRGDRAGALADLRGAERIFRPLHAGPRFSQWRSRLALALAGESRAEALELAEEELDLARRVDSPRAQGVALRALGMLTAGDGGVDLLRESVATLEGPPSPLDLARSLTELGARLRRGNRRSEARDRLREAADLAQRCGAELLEDRVLEELRIAGARPRRKALSGADSLTPAERRVVTAALGGSSNREIAQSLFVSLRTIEMHLTNSYRKLGISSRSQLPEAVGAEPPAGSAG